MRFCPESLHLVEKQRYSGRCEGAI